MNQQSAKPIFVAADLGAGNVKLRVQHKKRPLYRMSALISEISEEQSLAGVEGVYKDYVFHENGKNFFVLAKKVVRIGGLVSDNPGENPNLKVENAPHFLMGSLIEGKYAQPGKVNKVGVVLTHHDPVAKGAELRDSIKGEHELWRGNECYKFEFHLPKEAVLPEGSKLKINDDLHGRLDLGYLTALFTLWEDGCEIQREAPALGVNELITDICNSVELKRAIGADPVRDKVAEAIGVLIEDGQDKKADLMYRDKGKTIDIKKIYATNLTNWLKKACRNASTMIQERKGTNFKIYAIGGGVKLPGMKSALSKIGIDVYESVDPIYANVTSLYESEIKKANKDETFQSWNLKADESDVSNVDDSLEEGEENA